MTTTMPPQLANPGGTKAGIYISEIKDFTLNDIVILEDLAKKKEEDDILAGITTGLGRCSTALTSLCFAAIEQLGLVTNSGLQNMHDSDVRKLLKSGNQTNALSFFNLARTEGITTVSDDEVTAIYSLFRNPITHNLFPTYGLGISQCIQNPTDQLVIQTTGSFSLNVNSLAHCVKGVISILYSNIITSPDFSKILLIDSNIDKLNKATEVNLKNKYNDQKSASIRPHFQAWLPGVTF
jgi:hypothetical protein